MKVSKALKLKNQLSGDIAKLKTLLTDNNVINDKIQPEYNTNTILVELTEKIKELVDVKTAIAKANVQIYDKIFQIAELRGLVATLNAVQTKDGVEEAHSFRITGAQTNPTTYKSQIDRKTLDANIKSLEERIQLLQEELDTFNFTTEV